MAKKKSRSQKNKPGQTAPQPPAEVANENPIDDSQKLNTSEDVGDTSETEKETNPDERSQEQSVLSSEERIRKTREDVQSVLQKLLDKEDSTRKRLKSLEVQLKPLHQTAQRIRENVDLSSDRIKLLWKQAKQNSVETATKIKVQTGRVLHLQERCRILELVMLRQCNLIDAVTMQPSRVLEQKLVEDRTRSELVEKQVMAWIHKGEQRYLGIESPQIEEPHADEVIQLSEDPESNLNGNEAKKTEDVPAPDPDWEPLL